MSRDHDSAAVSLRLVFGAEYDALNATDALNVRADYLNAFLDEGMTVGEYKRNIGAGNLQSYANCLRASYVIYSAAERAYWSNECGWGARAGATVFTQEERDTLTLPLGAGARWVRVAA